MHVPSRRAQNLLIPRADAHPAGHIFRTLHTLRPYTAMPRATTQNRHEEARLVELLLVEGDHYKGIQARKALAGAQVGEGARERYEVTQVATLREALVCLSARRYDAVLLNLFLPDSLGLGTLLEVRRRAPARPWSR